jgi:acyl-CoA synthetase (AMP-forming)/AMP-acid ligase II
VAKVGGYSVYPREVEEELRACPGVGDVAVVGLEDPVKGEIVAAAVEPAPGRQVTVAEVQAFAAAEVADYRRPTRVIVVDALPRNANGKVVKGQVRALFG